MKNSKFGRRVLAFVLVLVMVVSLLPLSIIAAATKGDIVTDSKFTGTGINNDTLNQDGTINWPIKVYDYLADGMLFEFAQNQSEILYSSNKLTTDVYPGQYVLGKPMPAVGVGHDFTNDFVFTSGQNVNTVYTSEKNTYKKTKMAAVDYQSPQYMRITQQSSYNESYKNCLITDFSGDNGARATRDNVRYMALVYRASGLSNVHGVNYVGFNTSYNSNGADNWRQLNNENGIKDINGNLVRNTSGWTCVVIDLYQNTGSGNWSSMGSIGIDKVYIRLGLDSTSDYFDVSHIAYFNNASDAKKFGDQCLEFIKEPGEYVSGTYWNGTNNTAFGMMYPSNGASWNSGGGTPKTSTIGGQYSAYYTHQIGYSIPEYRSTSATYNNNRKTGKDANGRFNGTGDLQGENGIYFITDAYYTSDQYQSENPGATSFDMSNLDFGGYNLLTQASKGSWTAGLLEGTLGADGTPQYKQETIEYIADLLSKTLTIPQKASNGYNNYSYIAGVRNAAQYGTTNGKANDLAQGLRNCLGITFSGNGARGTTPKMGSYAETMAKADKLKGAFLTVANGGYITTCFDAAYYLLHNLFIGNSYNQEQDDFRYLTLSSAELDNGQTAYVFDGGFTASKDPANYSFEKLVNGQITQAQYKANSENAVDYNGFENGGDGTISLKDVDAKDLYYYASADYARTTRFPFLPVTDAEGVYAGQTDSYYFAEDGKRNYEKEYGTYADRNYNYVMASNGEFVYHEEDNLFFEFEGDDDVYLFINGQLVLDLGGGHAISNCYFDVNDYVTWARNVLKNPSGYSEAEIARAEALDLENGEIVSFDFYYMERHGYGANMRVVTNMHITDPALRVEKTAYQGKQLEYGGIVDADDPIEYNFKLTNIGNTKLYNITFDDSDIGVSLTPDKGLFVAGDDTSTELDDINGYFVTDARGERLDAEDLTAVVTGYQNVGSGGDYIQSGHTYTKVASGAGTHIYHDNLIVNFADNEALKNFLRSLQSSKTDDDTVDEEQTQRGAGLWVDGTVTIKGIYYTMTKEQEEAGMFDNTVRVTATTRVNVDDGANETLRSEARHRVYVTAIPSYYQWADHDLFISKQRVTLDAASESSNESSMLHDYKAFFDKVGTDISKFGTKFCDRLGNVVSDSHYENVSIQQASDGQWGYVTTYPESGIYEFFLLMYLYGASGLPSDLSTLKASDLNLGDYAVVRVLVIVTDVEDAEYVLDYGLSTENLDARGELFKNDQLYGSLSGTEALLMGFTNQEPSYRYYNQVTDYNRIDFNALNLSENNKIQTEDGYYKVNLLIPDTGMKISYDEFSGMYTLTETGTTTIHVDCPAAWENLNLYYWYDDGRNNVWPGEKMTQTSHGNFEMAIPGNVPHIIISNGTNQTVDLHINAGQEAWVNIPGSLNDDGKLHAAVEYKTADGIIHAKVPDGWGDVYVYCWDAFGHGLQEWPGVKVEEIDENGFFTYHIPGDITNVIINNGDNGKQTDDLVVYAGSETWITVNDEPSGENEEMGVVYYKATSSRSKDTVKMHAKVPSNWGAAYLYYWNSNGSYAGVDWPGIQMTMGDDGYYHLENVPADVSNVIISDGGINQTHNLSDLTPGVETWFDVSVTSGEGETKLRAEVPSDWSNVYVYFFNDAGDVGTAWPGTPATMNADGTYTAAIPDNATKYIFNNNNGQQTQDLLIIRGTTNDIIVRGNNDAVARTSTTLHIEPEAGWTEAYVHYWPTNKTGTEWPGVAAKKNPDGTFSFTIPQGYNNFKIHNNAGSETSDISQFYMGIENHITINKDGGYRVGMPYETEIVYGEHAEKEGFTFTPTDFMDSYYSIWMAVTVHENKLDDGDQGDVTQNKATPLGSSINIGKEVQMYKKVTVLPANVVYYEDDFAGIKYNTSGGNVFNHFGNGSGSLSQSVDQNQQYGQDNTYQGSENDEITGGSLTEIDIKEQSEFASFEFTGTGFEIIGHTHAVESGTVRVIVKDENGNKVGEKVVITEFDNGADLGSESVVAVPIIRFSGLEFGKYSVSIEGVPVYDFSNFKPGTTTLPTKTSYIHIDGIRVYQPLDNSTSSYENLALGTNCDVEPYTGSPYTANLTDGKYDTAFQAGVNDAAWFGFKNTGDSSTGNVDPNNSDRSIFVLNLGVESEIKQIRLHHYKGTGADPFAYINVYYSSDGTSYKFLNTINPDSSKTGAYWATLDISSTPVNAKYIKFALSAASGKTVLVNEIEVYGTELPTPGRNDAYLETENGATFTEIRNLIAERNAFAIKYDDAAGLSVSGGTSTWIENRNNDLPSGYGIKWTSNTVHSVADYLLAGPNNEVYMIESTDKDKTALVFYVQEDDSHVHDMQIAVRALDYGSFIGSQETGLLNAEIQYGAMVDGALVWKHLTTTVSSAEQYFTIPYTECPYDAENNRYQVVIRIGDTDVTGMASYTSVKLNGLKTLMLNETEVPDVIHRSDDINNTLIDSYGNTLDTSKFVDFIGLKDQMSADVVVYNTVDDPAPEGVDTSALGTLYDSFTADKNSNFALTENSKFYIVSENEIKPANSVIETVQLAQSQYAVDDLPTGNALEVVWGKEQYAQAGDILIYTSSSYADEEFRIVVSDRARIYAKDDRGVLYALNTLQKHFRLAESTAIKGFTLQDKPDTEERTVHLDVARKYLTKDWIVNYIKEMSWMGYNALELHFSEDGGLRADLWGDPSLYTSSNGNNFSWTVGSRLQYWVKDCPDPDPTVYGQSGYLTTAELVEICQVATQHNIEIIPSFDTPAHVDWLTWNHYNNYSAKGITNTFNYGGQSYTLPTYINYRSSTTSDSRWCCLDLGNDTVQKFAFAMYADIAEFFSIHAGSTKFNIGGDEVGLTNTDTWNYADFYNYVNDLSAMLKGKGYTVRMYNDFLGRQKYINMLPSGTTMPTLDKDIEIVIWTVDNPYNDSYGLATAKSWYDEGRTVYNGMNYWTYYVLRYANTLASSNANYKKDARDTTNTNWSFYCNDEVSVYSGVANKYSHWNPTLFDKATTLSNKYTIWDDQLAGGYFMVWNDYAGLNTEVEMWNGVWDRSGSVNDGKYYYSLIERMWSNAAKQWDWTAHDTAFATFETLRDKMGFFPGYVATTSGSHANASESTRVPLTTVSNEAYRTSYTVTFKNYDGSVIDTQTVKEGFGATAPTAVPTRPSDAWYDYTFSGWDKDFSNITADTVVTAEYSEQATTAGRIGYLEVVVSGGTDFTMSIDGSSAKPMGIKYANSTMEFGKAITLVAQTTNNNRFVGWYDAKNGELLTTSASYSFFTSGNDVFMAVYDETLGGNEGLVTFRNDKNHQVIDIQYYSSTDTIEFPAGITYPGYEFVGWELTEAQIKEMLSQGQDVTVNPVWRVKDSYFTVDVNGGSVIESNDPVGGKYAGYKSIVVMADHAPSGKMFAYWIDEEGNILSYSEEYKFYPYKDTSITAIYVSDKTPGIDVTGTKPLPSEEEKDTFTVFFENNWNWSDVSIHYWGAGETSWPGLPMTFVENNGYYDVYSFEVPVGVTGIIFNGLKDDDSGNREQTPNIESGFVDGLMYRMKWDGETMVETDNSRVPVLPTDSNVLYIIAPESTVANGEWFAAYGTDPATGEGVWVALEHINGRIYKTLLPLRFSDIKIYRMVCEAGVYDTTGAYQILSGTISPTDEQNGIILNEDLSLKNFINVFEMFFVNELGWETFEIYYTDEFGTHEVTPVFVETDKNGNGVYSFYAPENAQKVIFTHGGKNYIYTPDGNIANRALFSFVDVDNYVEKDVIVNVGMDTSSMGNANVVVFEWCALAEYGYTFINAGLLLVKAEDYIESTFVKGTWDLDVIQFAPAKKYQVESGVHSVTVPEVAKGDSWIVCAFVQYLDKNGVLQTKYSKQVTGTK